jgi:hypothetical protein
MKTIYWICCILLILVIIATIIGLIIYFYKKKDSSTTIVLPEQKIVVPAPAPAIKSTQPIVPNQIFPTITLPVGPTTVQQTDLAKQAQIAKQAVQDLQAKQTALTVQAQTSPQADQDKLAQQLAQNQQALLEQKAQQALIDEQNRQANIAEQNRQLLLAQQAQRDEDAKQAQLKLQNEQTLREQLAQQAILDQNASVQGNQITAPLNQVFPTPDFSPVTDITYLPPDSDNLPNAVAIIHQANFKYNTTDNTRIPTNYILTLENSKLVWKQSTPEQSAYYPLKGEFLTTSDGIKKINPNLIPPSNLFNNQTFYTNTNNCTIKCSAPRSGASRCIQDASLTQDPECFSDQLVAFTRCYTLLMNTNKGPLAVTYKPDDLNKTVYELTVNNTVLNVPGKLILAPYNPNNTWQTIKETMSMDPQYIPNYPLVRYLVNLQMNDHITMPVVQPPLIPPATQPTAVYCPLSMFISVDRASSDSDPTGWSMVFSNRDDKRVQTWRSFYVQPLK